MLPAAALASYANHSGLAAFAPHLWVRIVRQIPGEYMRVALLYVALLVGSVVWDVTAVMWLGLVGALLREPVGCMFVFAMATGLGGVVHRNRELLGL